MTGLSGSSSWFQAYPFDVMQSQSRFDVWKEFFADKKCADGFCRCECLPVEDRIGDALTYCFESGGSRDLDYSDELQAVSDGVDSSHAQVVDHFADIVRILERGGSPLADPDVVIYRVKSVWKLGEKAQPDKDIFRQ